MKYRKLPIVIDAEIYKKGLEDGFECHAYESWNISRCNFNCGNGSGYIEQCLSEGRAKPYIKTLEGNHLITDGDYIITGIKGERYPCKPDVFKKTYEEVTDGE